MSVISVSRGLNQGSGVELLRIIKNSSTEVIGFAILTIKNLNSEIQSEGCVRLRAPSYSQSPTLTTNQNIQIENLFLSVLRRDLDIATEALTAGYESPIEYVEQELSLALWDHLNVVPDDQNMWIGSLKESSSQEVLMNNLNTIFTDIDNRFAEIELEGKAIEFGWLHTEKDIFEWPAKLVIWKINYNRLKQQVTENLQKELFSRDPEKRRREYLLFMNQIHKATIALSKKNEDYDLYDTRIPYLIEQCYTAWKKTVDQLNKMTNSEDRSTQLSHSITALREAILVRKVLPVALERWMSGSSSEMQSNVHCQDALVQWGNEQYHLGVSVLSEMERDPMLELLTPHFEAITASVMKKQYTAAAIIRELQEFYDKQSSENKKILLSPILELYKDALVKGSAPHIDRMEPLRVLYKSLEHTQGISDFDEYVAAIKQVRREFLEKGFVPTFSSNTPKEMAKDLLCSSCLGPAVYQKKDLRQELIRLIEISVPTMPLAEQTKLIELIIQYDSSETEEAKSEYLIKQKKRVIDVLSNLENQITLSNVDFLSKICTSHQETLRPAGAILLGISNRILSSLNFNERSIPEAICSSIAKQSAAELDDDLIAVAAEKLKVLPRLYTSLPEKIQNSPGIRALTAINPHIKYGISSGRYAILMMAFEDPSILLSASESIRGDKNFMQAVIDVHPWALCYAADSLRNNKAFILAAAARNLSVLRYVSDELKCDEQFILGALAQNLSALGYASNELKNNGRFMLMAAVQNLKALAYASDALKNDLHFIITATAQDPSALFYASNQMKTSWHIMLEVVRRNPSTLLYVNEEFKFNRNFLLEVVRLNPAALPHTDEFFRNDTGMIMTLISSNPEIARYLDEEYTNNRTFILAMVGRNPYVLQFVKEDFKNDQAIVYTAAVNFYGVFKYAGEVMRNNRDLAEIVIRKSNGVVFADIGDLLKNDKDFMLKAFSVYENSMKHAGPLLRNNREFLLEAVAFNERAMLYVSAELASDRSFALAAVSRNGKALLYISGLFRDDPEIIRAAAVNKKSV